MHSLTLPGRCGTTTTSPRVTARPCAPCRDPRPLRARRTQLRTDHAELAWPAVLAFLAGGTLMVLTLRLAGL